MYFQSKILNINDVMDMFVALVGYVAINLSNTDMIHLEVIFHKDFIFTVTALTIQICFVAFYSHSSVVSAGSQDIGLTINRIQI